MNNIEERAYFNRVVIKKRSKSFRKEITKKKSFFFWKRTADVLVSSFVLIFIFSWLYPLIAFLIKATSRGPVFFKQKRVGYLGRSFYCYKFRTMHLNKDADHVPAKENDDRITAVGNFLRKSNLDELPQFINVFLGQMSVVGPRPHMHADCRKFSNYVSEYKIRNLVKPGITGLAQVKGYRGPADTFEQIFHRFQFDTFYIRNANVFMDLRIIRKTAAQTLLYLLRFAQVARTRLVLKVRHN